MKKTGSISIFKNQLNLSKLIIKKKYRAKVGLIDQLKLTQLSKSINVIKTKQFRGFILLIQATEVLSQFYREKC